MTPPRQSRKSEARNLYAVGRSLPEIASILQCSPTTLRHWRRRDDLDGSSWENLRTDAERRSPANIFRMLQDQLADLVAHGPGGDDLSKEPGLYETRILRLTQAIARFRATSADITINLLALERFAVWCAEHATDDELATGRALVERYTDALRLASEVMLA